MFRPLVLTTLRAVARAAAVLAVAAVAVAAQPSPAAVLGTVSDSTGAPLPGSTVVLLSAADSVMVSFATADADGAFRVGPVPPGDYGLRVSFVGYLPFERTVAVQSGPIDVGRLVLEPDEQELGQIVVRAERVPMVVRGDTLDYDARAFRVPPGSDVEALLKRLPGVEVADDGSVRVRGRSVDRVLVDGKEFFGDDPTIATRNLPADAVDRVQIYDGASEVAEFTGVDDGVERTTINLALDDDARAGYFGSVEGGLGTLSDAGEALAFDGRASVNRFTPSTQVSLIANGNNVNRQSFSVQDYLSFMGGPASLTGSDGLIRIRSGEIPVGDDPASGFATTASGGLNLNHDFGPRTSLRTSYLGYRLRSERGRRTVQRGAFGSDRQLRIEEGATDLSRSRAHRVDLAAEHEFGNGHDLQVEADLRLGGSAFDSESRRESMAADGALEALEESDWTADAERWGGGTSLRYRRRFGARSVVAELRGSFDDTRDDEAIRASDDLHTQTSLDARALDQDVEARTGAAEARVLFTEPITRAHVLQFTLEHTRERGHRTLGLADSLAGTARRTEFERTLRTSSAALTYRSAWSRYRLLLRARFQQSSLAGGGFGSATSDRSTHVLPSVTLTRTGAQQDRVELRYRESIRHPSARQLDPGVHRPSATSTYSGNPDLLPERVRSLSLRMTRFDALTSRTLLGYVRVSRSSHAISYGRTVDPTTLRQTVSPLNLGPRWSAFADATLSSPIRPIGGELDLSLDSYFDRRREVVNGSESTSDLFRTTIDVGLGNRRKEVWDLRAGARFEYGSAAYSLAPDLDRSYLNSALYAELGWTPSDAWSVQSTADVRAYGGHALGATGNGRPLVSLDVSRAVLDGRARVHLVASDLLDRGLGVTYTDTASYTEEERVDTLGRRVLVKFSYTLGQASGLRTSVQ